tara:strand:+ start:378 stop:1571 length:1194 start_codon:yes stop_codon:yes gene_type:complete
VDSSKISAHIKEIASSIFPDIVSIRKWLHMHPELSFKEKETSKYICSILKKNNIYFINNIGGYGIVATVKGKNPDSKVIAFRADMDALPIEEKNEVDYKSIHKGVMHACGHDVHTSILIGTAIIINKLKEHLEGTIKFIFQPAEEKLPGGASLMIKDGVLSNPKVDKIIALHVFPEMQVGFLGFREGKYMAACDELEVTVQGKGGHAALPEKTINPITVAAEIIIETRKSIKQIGKDNLYVLEYGDFHASGASNVIPENAFIKGTFRTMNEDFRKKACDLLLHKSKEIAIKYGVDCDYKIIKGYPSLFNNPKLTEECRELAIDFIGLEHISDLPIRMASEDFSFYSQACQACFFRLGVNNKEKGITHLVHTPKFDIDHHAIEIGIGLMSYFAIKLVR